MKQSLLELRPQDGEAAVLSLLAAADGGQWVVACGSLLTVPAKAAHMSWPAWAATQPLTRGPRRTDEKPDLGASFTEEAFPGLRIMRVMVEVGEWGARVEELEGGFLTIESDAYHLNFEDFGASQLFGQEGLSSAHKVLLAAQRPVRGVAMELQTPELPPTEAFWVRGGSGKPMLEQSREELKDKETFQNWPAHLLGIRWLGTSEFPPPHSFVVGKAQTEIWIADVVPDYENEQIKIVLAWDAGRVDPFGCSLLVRADRDGAALLARHWKISDLPGEGAGKRRGEEARDLAWDERTIEVRLPRGPRRTDFGVSLLGPDGWLADERPVARCYEQMTVEIGVMGAPGPASKSTIGDPDPDPTDAERDQAAAAARQLEEETRRIAAHRRLTTTGELEKYLRWRISARAGELLILDRYLFEGKANEVEPVIEFLAGFGRPIRALVAKNSAIAAGLLLPYPKSRRGRPRTRNFTIGFGSLVKPRS